MFSFKRLLRLAFSAAMAGSALSPGKAVACNFLEEVFGGCRPAPAYVAPSPDVPAPSRRAKRRSSIATTRNAEDYKQHPLATPDGVATGSIAHFSADSTLRKGDIVVTSKGFLVYRGDGSEGAVFAPLGRKQAGLNNLERASRPVDGDGWSAPSKLAVSPRAPAVTRVQRAAAEETAGAL